MSRLCQGDTKEPTIWQEKSAGTRDTKFEGEREREGRRKMKKSRRVEGDDIVPRLHPNYLILPETARNPGYSATVRFQRPNSSSRPGIRGRWSQFLPLYAAKEGKMECRPGV